MRYLPGVLLSVLLVGAWAILAGLKADSVETRRAAFAIEHAMRFWPEVLWRGSWVYPGQRGAMFGTYGLVAPQGLVLAVTVGLLLLWSGIAVRLAGVWRVLLVFVAAWVLAPLAAAWAGLPPFGGASGAVHGLAGAGFAWAMRRGDRETAGVVGLSVLAGIGAYALAGGQAVALDAAGLAVGALLGVVLKTRSAAPGGGA